LRRVVFPEGSKGENPEIVQDCGARGRIGFDARDVRDVDLNVIVGARNEEQLRQNLGAVGWSLTPEQVAKLDTASATTLAYPYWHQRGFTERNPPPVS
jgi:hypothetical protein